MMLKLLVGPDDQAGIRGGQHHQPEGDAVPGERGEVVRADVTQQPAHAQEGRHEGGHGADAERALLSAADLPLFGIGTVAAFVSAFLCVRWLLRYISSHDFTAFAWYRIAFGLMVLATAYTGLIVWAD